MKLVRHCVETQRTFGRKVCVDRYNILTKRRVVKPTMRVTLGQLVKSTEHLCVLQKEGAAAVEALCLLQDREEGTADPIC